MKTLIQTILDEQRVQEDLRGAAVSAALAGAMLLNPMTADAKTTKHHHHPKQTQHQVVDVDANLVAKVIAGEAAGEGYTGMKAVTCVIQNRGGKPKDVVKKPHQFSVISKPAVMKANYAKVKTEADELAAQIGKLDDITDGATYYMTKDVYDTKMAMEQSWVQNLTYIKQIGNHVFLKE